MRPNLLALKNVFFRERLFKLKAKLQKNHLNRSTAGMCVILLHASQENSCFQLSPSADPAK